MDNDEIKDIDTEKAYKFGVVLALQELVSEWIADYSELVKFLHRDMQVRVIAYMRPFYLDNRLVSAMKTVLGSIQRISTKSIYDVLLKDEFSNNENFKLRIELVYDDFSLRNTLEFTCSTTVRSHMWKIIQW